MSTSINADLAPENLKPVLHCKIEAMSPRKLQLLDKILLQLEAEEQAEQLGHAFEQDYSSGKLAQIPEMVHKFRSENAY